MSVAPNLCCDETKNRGTYTRVTLTFYKTRQLATWLQVSPKCQVQTGFQAYSSKKKKKNEIYFVY